MPPAPSPDDRLFPAGAPGPGRGADRAGWAPFPGATRELRNEPGGEPRSGPGGTRRGGLVGRLHPSTRTRRPYRWRVLAWRSRFLLAAASLGTAAALASAEMRPAPPPEAAVVVAARPVTPGTALTGDDVRVQHVPERSAVDGAYTDAAALLGRVTVVAVPAGLPVVDSLLARDRLAGSGPPGTVVAPVRLADAGVAALLRPGDRVDLFAAATSATGGPAAQRLAERAVVLPPPAPARTAAASAPGLLGSGPDDDGTGSLTVVAVTPEQAQALAGAAAWAGITAVLVE